MCKISERDEAIKLGQCLLVPIDLLQKVDERCATSESHSLEDIIYCSEDSMGHGECPECEYDEVTVGYYPVQVGELVLTKRCVIHEQVFGRPFPKDTTPEQIKMYELAIKQLT